MPYGFLSPLARQEDSSLIYHWPTYPGNPAENCWIDVVSGLAMVANNISDDNSTLTPHGGLGWERTNGGNAMDFNGGTASESIIQDWEAISISLWFKFHATSGNNNRWLVNKFWDGSNRSFNLESNSSDKVSWNISTNSTHNNGGPESVTGIAAAKWYYLTVTWEAGTSNNAKLFLNGRLDDQTTRSGTTVRNNNEELRFAGSYNGGNAFSALGDIRIYRRALTESEHRRLYLYPQRGKKLIVPVSSGTTTAQLDITPTDDWRFNEPSNFAGTPGTTASLGDEEGDGYGYGVLFPLDIAQGTTINSAYIAIYNIGGLHAGMEIYGFNDSTADAVAPTNYPEATDFVSFSGTDLLNGNGIVAGENLLDITSLIQGVLDNPSFSQNNDVVITLTSGPHNLDVLRSIATITNGTVENRPEIRINYPAPATIDVTASPATFTMTAVPVASAGSDIAATASPATFNMTAAPASASAGLSVDASPATFTMTAAPVAAADSELAANASPATFALVAAPVSAAGPDITVASSPATFAMSAVAVNYAGTNVVAEPVPATFTMTAQPIVSSGPDVSAAASPATFAMAAVPVDNASLPQDVEPLPATFTMSAVAAETVFDGTIKYWSFETNYDLGNHDDEDSYVYGEAVNGFTFVLINQFNGNPVTSGTVDGYIVKDGGTQVPLTNSPSHTGNGQCKIDFTAEEMTADVICVLFVPSSAWPIHFVFVTDNHETHY